MLSRIDNLKVPPAWEKARIARASYISPRVIDYYLEGSVVAYHAQHLDEVIAATTSGKPRNTEPEGGQTVKKAIAIKLLRSKTARRVAIKALQNKRVRKIAVDVAKRRVLGR